MKKRFEMIATTCATSLQRGDKGKVDIAGTTPCHVVVEDAQDVEVDGFRCTMTSARSGSNAHSPREGTT